jgi:hypothetical protein
MSIVVLLVALVACPTTKPPATPQPPFVSALGTLTGTPTTKTIGVTGGSLSSADGNITLEIPAGAFSSDTQISLQPVINPVAPWGAGTGFRFAGLTGQLKPITIKLKFEGDPPKESLSVAIQDTLGAWRGFKQMTVDETTKTINLTLKPNSITKNASKIDARGTKRDLDVADVFVFSHFFVFPGSASVKVNATQDFTLEVCNLIDNSDPGEDLLVSLNPPQPSECIRQKPEDMLQTWAVNGVTNGSNTFGKVVADPIGATFTAPTTVPSSNPVIVSATIHPGGKTLTATANVTIVGTGLKVVGKFSALGYPACPGFVGAADMTDQVDFLLAETGSASGFPYIVQVLDNKITKSQNFHATEAAAGGSVSQDSPSEVLNVLNGKGEFKGSSETIAVTLAGLSWTGGCTLTYPGGTTYILPAGESIESSASFEFKTNAFVNNTQTVKGEDSSGFGSWEFTITKQ